MPAHNNSASTEVHVRPQVTLPTPMPVADEVNEFEFKVRDRDRSAPFALWDIAGENSLDGGQDPEPLPVGHDLLDTRAVILRVDKEVLVQQSLQGDLNHVSGAFTDLNWAVLEGLARAIGSLLPRVLAVEPGDLTFRCGFLIGPATLCPAAIFSIGGQAQARIDHDALIEAIQRCVDQLKDPALWDHTQPIDGDHDEQTTWEMVEAAQKARREIPGRNLPFSCTVACSDTDKTVKIGPELVRAKPRRTQQKEEDGVGVLTGYCTHARVIKFKGENSDAVFDIGFDEAAFLDRVFEFTGRNPHTVEAKWSNVSIDGVISYRSLLELKSLVKPLL